MEPVEDPENDRGEKGWLVFQSCVVSPITESHRLFLVLWALKTWPHPPQGFSSQVKAMLLVTCVLPVWNLFPVLLDGSRVQGEVIVSRAKGGTVLLRLGVK